MKFKMFSRHFHRKVPLLLAGCLLIGRADSLLGGDKIQFSTPLEREEQPIDIKSSRPNAASSALQNATAPALPGPSMPIIAAPRLANRPEDKDKNKNWLSAPVEKEETSLEDFLKTDGFDSFTAENEKRQEAFFGKPLSLKPTANPAMKELDAANIREESVGRSSLFPTQADYLAKTAAPSWDSALAGNKLKTPERASALGDFWNQNLNLSALTEQMQIRKSEIANLWQTKSSANPVNALTEAAKPLADSPAALGDSLSRTRQTSLSDQWTGGSPLTGVRSTVVENVNTRALGRMTSETEVQKNTPPVFAKPQPAILPFPTRPGQLFR